MFSFMDEWNNNFTELLRIKNKYRKIINNDQNNPLYNFHRKITNLLNVYTLNEKFTTKNAINNLLVPMVGIVELELSENLNNEYASEVHSSLLKLGIVETKWKTTVNGYAYLFRRYSESIKDSYDALVKSKDYFHDKTKIAKIWNIK